MPWNLPLHEQRKRKSQDSVLDPAERAVVRVAGKAAPWCAVGRLEDGSRGLPLHWLAWSQGCPCPLQLPRELGMGGMGRGRMDMVFGSTLALSHLGRAPRELFVLSTLGLRDDWASPRLGLGDIKMSN